MGKRYSTRQRTTARWVGRLAGPKVASKVTGAHPKTIRRWQRETEQAQAPEQKANDGL